MTDTTENSMESVIEMIANPKAAAPETTARQSQTSDTEDYDPEDATGAAESDYDAEADGDEVDAGDTEDNPDTDEAEEDAPEKPQVFTVTVDGKEKSVGLDELRRGYSGQAKIQQDLQANAEVRKQLEAAAQYMMNQQEQILQLHQRAQQGNFKRQPQAPDRRLLDTDATAYMRQRAQYEDDVASYQGEQAQMSQYQRQQAAYQEQQQAQKTASEFELLKEQMPEFADPKTAPDAAKKLVKAGTYYGFTNEELSNLNDRRAVRLLSDAAKWQNLVEKQAQTNKPPQPTRNLRPQAAVNRAPNAEDKARRKMRQSGSVDDVAAFLMSK